MIKHGWWFKHQLHLLFSKSHEWIIDNYSMKTCFTSQAYWRSNHYSQLGKPPITASAPQRDTQRDAIICCTIAIHYNITLFSAALYKVHPSLLVLHSYQLSGSRHSLRHFDEKYMPPSDFLLCSVCRVDVNINWSNLFSIYSPKDCGLETWRGENWKQFCRNS